MSRCGKVVLIMGLTLFLFSIVATLFLLYLWILGAATFVAVLLFLRVLLGLWLIVATLLSVWLVWKLFTVMR